MIPSHRDALLLRCFEIMSEATQLPLTETQKLKVYNDMKEIMPGLEYEARMIHEEGE